MTIKPIDSPMETAEQRAARKAAKKERKALKRKLEDESSGTNGTPSPPPAVHENAMVDVAPPAPTSVPSSVPTPEEADEIARKEAKRARKDAKAAARAAKSSSPPPSPHVMENTNTNGNSSVSVHSTMTASEVAEFRKTNEMALFGDGNENPRFYPVRSFTECNFPAPLLQCVQGFAKPTPIQSQCWPVVLSGRDAIGIAETGSGKTLGYMLPGCAHLLKNKKPTPGKLHPSMLVLAPTRELATQIAEVAESACKPAQLKSICIYGGVDKLQQKHHLSKGVDMIIATPGRLLNLINENSCTLGHVSYIVLDEADRMLDMGFEPDIRAIMALVKPIASRQTLMFSATWPETIQKLAHEFIRNPLQICIGNLEQENTTNKNIKQIVEVMEDRARDQRLIQLLKQHHTRANPQKMLIFVLYKKEVDRIERLINQNGFSCRGISSDKTQADRSRAIEDFKANKLLLLVATDVAARGLDIDNVMIVINYSFPLTIEDYVHRIGRTGRGGKSGTAITFFCRNEKHLAGELVNVLNEAGETVPPELLKFGIGIKKKKHGMYGDHFKNDDRPMKQATKITFD